MLEQLASLTGRPGALNLWITKEMISVVIPGVLILLELVLVLQPMEWGQFLSLVNDVKVGGVVLFSIAGVCLAYVLGHYTRSLEFAFLGWATEPPPAPADSRLQMDGHPAEISEDIAPPRESSPESKSHTEAPTVGNAAGSGSTPKILKRLCNGFAKRTFWKHFKPHLSGPQMKTELQSRMGAELVDDFLKDHRLLDWLLSTERSKTPFGNADHDGTNYEDRRGGALEDVPSVEAFGYAKNWLRHEAPTFGVEEHELSINVAAALIAPLVLLPIACLRIPSISPTMQLSAAIFSLCGLTWCMVNFRANRGWERIGALDRMISVWEIRRNKTQLSLAPPEPKARAHGLRGAPFRAHRRFRSLLSPSQNQ